MAFSNQIMALALVLSLGLALPPALAEVICENLHINQCAFAVSSTSKRCILEGNQCKTTNLELDSISNHIETEACVRTCGLEGNTVGIMSYKSLMDSRILQKLCSMSCKINCENLLSIAFKNNEAFFTPC